MIIVKVTPVPLAVALWLNISDVVWFANTIVPAGMPRPEILCPGKMFALPVPARFAIVGEFKVVSPVATISLFGSKRISFTL